jgi:hypothetical protein
LLALLLLLLLLLPPLLPPHEPPQKRERLACAAHLPGARAPRDHAIRRVAGGSQVCQAVAGGQKERVAVITRQRRLASSASSDSVHCTSTLVSPLDRMLRSRERGLLTPQFSSQPRAVGSEEAWEEAWQRLRGRHAQKEAPLARVASRR